MWTRLASWLLPLLCVVAGCEQCGCGTDTPVARLVSAQPPTERDHDATREAWETAAEGATFLIGDAVRTGQGGAAVAELTQGAQLHLGPESLVRFLDPNQETTVALEAGEVEVVAGGQELTIDTGRGRAVVQPGAELVLFLGDGGSLRFEVQAGDVQYIDRAGRSQPLSAAGFIVEVDEGVRIERRGDATEEAEEPPETQAAVELAEAPPASGPVSLRIDGSGARLRESETGRWQRVNEGPVDVSEGASIRLGRQATAEVRRGDARVRLESGGTASVADGENLVSLSRGNLVGASGERETERLQVPGGTIVLRPHSRVEVTVDRRGVADVRATRGSVELHTGEESRTLRAGENATVRDDGDVAREQGPDRADLLLPAGTSCTIHDASAPTNVGLRVEAQCSGDALVEVAPGARSRRGRGHVFVRLAPGRHEYRVRCIENGSIADAVVAEGTVRVIRDAGNAPISTGPVPNTVDADGRRYTVLFQNALPLMTLVWPDAPPSGTYTLVVSSARGRPRTVPNLARPRHRFNSGQLTEGDYTFDFQTDEGRRSPTGRLKISFDNAVSTVWLRHPANGAGRPGEPVRVAGVALRGSTVRVGGVELSLDGQHRFDGMVAAPTDQDSIAVRVDHPTMGVHYFLRSLPVHQ